MQLTCPGCRRVIDAGSDSWPGDSVVCPDCGLAVEPARATTDIPALSPSLMGESPERPVRLREDEALPAGTLVGQYRIEAPIGRGGMGAVYRAVHTMLDRVVALKILPPDFAADGEFVNRFKREAMALAKLHHPNIVGVHDMGIQGEIYWFAMEFVDGLNLRRLLADKSLSASQALHVVPKLCEALEYAHGQGIVHRDIKPENIIIDKDGTPKIADFGLAKILKGDAAQVGLTRTSVVMGTVDYMAPEQRENTRGTDHRADIYSMGVVLYEMLTGELPSGRFDLPSEKVHVDVRLDEVVIKALQKDPERRYQRAGHMGGDVTSILSGPGPAKAGLAVRDMQTNRELGSSLRRAVSIESATAAVTVASWGNDHIGVTGAADVTAPHGTAMLRATGPALSVFVPRDMDVAVTVVCGAVAVSDVSGRLTINNNSGSTSVAAFRGSLVVQQQDGNVEIDDLSSSDVAVDVRRGNLTVGDLKFRAGEANFSVGRGHVSIQAHKKNSAFTYELTASHGEISPPSEGVLDRRRQYVLGRFVAPGGTLRATVDEGNIKLGAFVFDAEKVPQQLKAFWSRAPAKYKKEVGQYVIVCAALTLLFGVWWDSWFVPTIVWIFWGMSVATKGWSLYTTGATDGDKKGEVLRMDQPGATPPPPEPPAPKPRVPAFVVFAMMLTVLGLMAAAGLVGVSMFDARAEALNIESEIDEMHLAMGVLTFVIIALGAAAGLFSLGAMASMVEVPDHLRGRGAARFCAFASILTIAYAVTMPWPHVSSEGLQRPDIEAVLADYDLMRALDEFKDARRLQGAALERYAELRGATLRVRDISRRHNSVDVDVAFLRDPAGVSWSYRDKLRLKLVQRGGTWVIDEDELQRRWPDLFPSMALEDF